MCIYKTSIYILLIVIISHSIVSVCRENFIAHFRHYALIEGGEVIYVFFSMYSRLDGMHGS